MRYDKIVYWLSYPIITMDDLIETDLTLDEVMFIANNKAEDAQYDKTKQEIFYELSN